MRTLSIFSFFVFLSFIISNSVEARGFGRRASDFKGFNPCGWNSCQGGGVRRVGPIRRLFQGRRVMPSGGCRSGMCGPRQGGGCGGGSCGAGQQRFPSQQGFHGGGQGGVHGGGQGGFNGGGPGASSQVPGQSQGGRPYADSDEVPAPSLDEDAGTQKDEDENLTADAKAGKKIFEQNCIGCHTQDKGVIAAIKDWKKEEWEQAIDAVKDGRMPKNKPRSIQGKELENIIAYFKSQIAKEDLVAEGKKEQKEVKADAPQAQPPVPGANPLPQGSSASSSAGPTPQVFAHSNPEPVAAPSFDALTADLTEKTTGDLLIAREATKGIRFSQEEVEKEDQRREKIDSEISRRQQAASRTRMLVLRPKRVVAAQASTIPLKTFTSGLDKRVNQLVDEFLLKQLDPMNRFKRRTGEVEAPSAYESSTMRAPNLQLQGYRW